MASRLDQQALRMAKKRPKVVPLSSTSDHPTSYVLRMIASNDEAISVDDEMVTNYLNLNKVENAIGQTKLYKPKIAEYATVKKRLREAEYALKSSEDRNAILEAELDARDEALNEAKATLNFDFHLAQALQARIDKEKISAVKEFKESSEYKEKDGLPPLEEVVAIENAKIEAELAKSVAEAARTSEVAKELMRSKEYYLLPVILTVFVALVRLVIMFCDVKGFDCSSLGSEFRDGGLLSNCDFDSFKL
ncbi:hypothetical protein AKJ16_DCAP04475, partial [Drosera capensis]